MAGSCGVDGTFVRTGAPSPITTMSVKVPPTSTPSTSSFVSPTIPLVRIGARSTDKRSRQWARASRTRLSPIGALIAGCGAASRGATWWARACQRDRSVARPSPVS